METKENKSLNDSPYHLKSYDSVPKEYEEILYKGISNDAIRKKGMSPMSPVSVVIKGFGDQVFGGASGVILYGALYIDLLWVDGALRGEGWGTRLMLEIEKIGKEGKAQFATLNTMDWEALGFYQKLGYSIEFIREGYEKSSKMYMLRKPLTNK